jgi:hypothetical protein
MSSDVFVCVLTIPIIEFASSIVPYVSTLKESLETLDPSPKLVEPLSPVLV